MSTSATTRRWYQRIGPGLITACVVIGPGSILTSSRVGANHGYSMGWVIVSAVVFMLTYTTLGAKLGVVSPASAGKMIADRAGRWLAVAIGVGVFFISAAFQFGNNLGVRAALAGLWPAEGTPEIVFDAAVVIFNGLAIACLFGLRNFYQFIERLMMVLVGVMLVSFAINLGFAKPSVGDFLRGLAPGVSGDAQATWDLSLLGLVGTTFVITAAFFQSYLVRQKGWTENDLAEGLVDVRIGVVLLSAITLMIMATAACVLRGQTLTSVAQVGEALRPSFGATGHALFCLGLFSAAYSSFLVNSMIGGFILADGLGLSREPGDTWSRLMTVIVLLTGMAVALAVSRYNFNPVGAIVAAQAMTVLASPLVAGALWWLTNQSDIMGKYKNGLFLNTLAALGFIVLLAMAYYTATTKVIPALQGT